MTVSPFLQNTFYLFGAISFICFAILKSPEAGDSLLQMIANKTSPAVKTAAQGGVSYMTIMLGLGAILFIAGGLIYIFYLRQYKKAEEEAVS